MFDPQRLYTRRQRKTHKGQIIQKRPVDLMGSISSDDYGKIAAYADSLGYQLIRKYINPFPEQVLFYADYVYHLANLPPTIRQLTQLDVANIIENMELMGFAQSSGFKVIGFSIHTIIENIFVINPSESASATAFLLSTPHIDKSQPPSQGANQFYLAKGDFVMLFGSDQDGTYYLQNATPHQIPWDEDLGTSPILGPVDSQILVWEGDEASSQYTKYQTKDPSLGSVILLTATAGGLNQLTRQIRIEFHVQVAFHKIFNYEFIGQ